MVPTLSSQRYIKYLFHVMFFLKVTIKGGLLHNAQSPQVTMAEEETGLCVKMKLRLRAGIAGLHTKSEQHYKEICSPRL